jgi:hypothetical protein
MNEIKVDHVKIGDIEYPAFCDLRVLEQLQEKYETITKFERELLGKKLVYDDDGNPERNDDGSLVKEDVEGSIRAIVDGLLFMIQEGQRLTGEKDLITEDEIYACIGNPFLLKYIVHALFYKCFESKKKEQESKSRKTKK